MSGKSVDGKSVYGDGWVWPNKRGGTCWYCGVWVPAGEGEQRWIRRHGRKVRVRHDGAYCHLEALMREAAMTEICGETCSRHPDAYCMVRVPKSLQEARGAFRGADKPHPHLHVYSLHDGGMVTHSWGPEPDVERYAYGHGGRMRACTREEAERLMEVGQ